MSTKHEDGLGGSITILEHGSEMTPMRFRMLLPKGFGPPAPECHPSQSEDFAVVRGVLDLGIIDGKHVVLRAGDSFHLPAGVYHLPRNTGDEELEFEAVLTPGLESGAMFTDLYRAMREHAGLAQFARVSLVFRRHTRSIQFKAPVRGVMTVVAAFARFFGVKALAAPVEAK
jgi:mannose-6-phosphate isomerase-like protein (cupin superfamily)